MTKTHPLRHEARWAWVFILPALFIIILGPVAMIIVETFKQV